MTYFIALLFKIVFRLFVAASIALAIAMSLLTASGRLDWFRQHVAPKESHSADAPADAPATSESAHERASYNGGHDVLVSPWMRQKASP